MPTPIGENYQYGSKLLLADRGPDQLPALPRRAPPPHPALQLIEHTFGKTRRRVKVIGPAPSPKDQPETVRATA
jgi:hypothetical protein